MKFIHHKTLADQIRIPAPDIAPGLASVNQAIDNIGSPTSAQIAAALALPQNLADAIHAAFGAPQQ